MRDGKIIVAAMQDRRAYDRVREYIQKGEFTPMGDFWWKLVKDWYGRDTKVQSVDPELLLSQGKRKAGDRHRETMVGYFQDLPTNVSGENVVQELLEIKRTNKQAELSNAIVSGAEPSKLLDLTTELSDLLRATELRRSTFKWTMDDDEMFSMLDRENLIKIAPRKLNEKTGGGAVRGDHIVIFGRPNSGKSLFCVNMTSGFLKMGLKVLYIGNEESTYKTRMRILTNLCNAGQQEVEKRKEEALTFANKRGYERLHICHLEPGSIAEVDELLGEVRPDVLIVDQIRNLGGAGEKLTQKMERNAIELRALIARYDVVGVSVTQANDRTERHGQEPPIWLGMSDVDSSRTGLPAQADLMIGLASTQEMRDHNTMAVSLPKNKLGNNHEGFTVSVDSLRNKVR